MIRILALEPFYGGSHRAFLDGLVGRSRHSYHLLTLPSTFWKWRMRGAALTMARQAQDLDFTPDLIFASDMLSLAEFKTLAGLDAPAVLYLHENQLSYPTLQADQRDIHFGFTNLTSCLAADRIIWNSRFHLTSFLEALPGFLQMMPDHRPKHLAETIAARSTVIAPGLDLDRIDAIPDDRADPPLIIWNHRWEFDKRPEDFFAPLYALAEDGVDFRVALLGENFQVKPQAFLEARDRLGPRLAHYGFVKDRDKYLRWLRRGTVSVSTADQENFGLAAVEAAYSGALPLWPTRLSYPELLSPDDFPECFYRDQGELVLKLRQALVDRSDHDRRRQLIQARLRRFDWSNLIDSYDDLFEQAAA